jgi:hypothetical protein
MVYTGLKAVIGSWKIMAMSLPRISRRRVADIASRSSPRNSTLPDTLAVRGSRPSSAMALTDLPDPDSPTMARVSPARSS